MNQERKLRKERPRKKFGSFFIGNAPAVRDKPFNDPLRLKGKIARDCEYVMDPGTGKNRIHFLKRYDLGKGDKERHDAAKNEQAYFGKRKARPPFH